MSSRQERKLRRQLASIEGELRGLQLGFDVVLSELIALRKSSEKRSSLLTVVGRVVEEAMRRAYGDEVCEGLGQDDDQDQGQAAPEPDRPPRACRPRAFDAYLAPVKRRRNRPPRLPKHGGEAA